MTRPYDITLLVSKELENMTLTDELKCKVLKNHFIPIKILPFQKLLSVDPIIPVADYLGNPFVYSVSSDSIFCRHCAMFLH